MPSYLHEKGVCVWGVIIIILKFFIFSWTECGQSMELYAMISVESL